MKKRNKKIAVLLSAALLVSNMNVFGNAEFLVSSKLGSLATTTGSAVVVDETKEVVYNTGNYNVTVGTDVTKNATNSATYKLFDENDSYVINVEDNAFFPYEVQFNYGGETFTKWFETMDSTVEVGGHTFYINSNYTNTTTFSQLGIWVGDDYVPVRPEPKTFKNMAFTPQTLLPIQTVNTTLDLSSYHIFELKKAKVSAIIGGIIPSEEFDENDVILYSSYSFDDDFTVLSQEDTLNLSNIYSSIQFIIGNGKQLDLNNTRYIVNVVKPTTKENIFTHQIVKVVDNVKTDLVTVDESTYMYDTISRFRQNSYFDVSQEELKVGSLQVSLNIDVPDGATYEVYEGDFTTVEAAEKANKITSSIVNIDLYNSNGYNLSISSGRYATAYFTAVVNYNGVKHLCTDYLSISYSSYVNLVDIYDLENNELGYDDYDWDYEYNNGVSYDVYTLYERDANANYKVNYKFSINGTEDNTKVLGAFVGNYKTLEEAKSKAIDIKADLFGTNCYTGNFSGEGIVFTIFTQDGYVHKEGIKIKASIPKDDINNVVSNLPNPGSSDTNFNVNKLYNFTGKSYILPYQHDTYYDMGYQTLFIQDKDYDLSNLKLQFYKPSTVNIYSGHSGSAGTLQESNVTVQDFSNGPVQYAAASENGQELKNYWVTAVKQQSGPSLFVNGINGDDGVVREVYLTSRHDYIHDIFIANIGDQDITNLNVELVNAQNVKLDNYWTVGGENNNVLGAFTATNTAQAKNGYYLSNVSNAAKIRLVPSNANGGTVSGTLKISGDGIEPVEITLKGNAGNPTFKTTEIPNGVKYVPYAVQLMQNNKYYWNKVTFEIQSGKLPNGLVLRENGEIYGVPKEAGKFSVNIKLDNSDTMFSDSYQTLDFEIAENTNENVANATDEGYELEEVFGTVQNGENIVDISIDELFHSTGELAEFQDFWLNGEKLVKGVDYIAEEGSTKITVKSQTLNSKASKTATNTIAAEFRVGGDTNNELKRTAQNFKTTPQTNGGGNSGGGSSGGGNTSGGNSNSGNSTGGSTTTTTSKDNDEVVKVVVPQEIIGKTEEVNLIVKSETVITDGVWNANIESDKIKTALDSVVNENKTDKKYTVAVELTNIDNDARNINFNIEKDGLEAIASNDGVALTINSDGIFTITLDNETVKTLKEFGSDINVKVEKDAEGVLIEFYSNGELINTINGGIKIALYDVAKGEVIIIVEKNGVEDLVKKSTVKDTDVFAIINGSGKVKVVNTSRNFSDVKENAWYNEVVKAVNSRKLLNGVDANNFAPNATMSRGMVATMLQRLEDGTVSGTTNTFKDVNADAWYSEGAQWASNVGLIKGTGNGEFSPNDDVSREQLAVILYNYANYLGMDTKARGDLTSFNDYSKTSSWSEESVRWAVASGLIKGDGTNINAKGNATRAEVSAIIMRFIDLMVK